MHGSMATLSQPHMLERSCIPSIRCCCYTLARILALSWSHHSSETMTQSWMMQFMPAVPACQQESPGGITSRAACHGCKLVPPHTQSLCPCHSTRNSHHAAPRNTAATPHHQSKNERNETFSCVCCALTAHTSAAQQP